MSSRAVRTHARARWALSVSILPLILATACSSGSSTHGSAATGSAAAAAAKASAAAGRSPLPVSSQAAAAAARPNGTATCRMLPARRAQALIGGKVAAGVKDRRKQDAGRRQLDGCAYSNSSVMRLSYLVWQVTSKTSKGTVANQLPASPTGTGRFNPKVGDLSAGALVKAGPTTTVAQVNALRKGRLVEVTVTGPNTQRAQAAATSAARTMIGA
jgi:hypothetical protein